MCCVVGDECCLSLSLVRGHVPRVIQTHQRLLCVPGRRASACAHAVALLFEQRTCYFPDHRQPCSIHRPHVRLRLLRAVPPSTMRLNARFPSSPHCLYHMLPPVMLHRSPIRTRVRIESVVPAGLHLCTRRSCAVQPSPASDARNW